MYQALFEPTPILGSYYFFTSFSIVIRLEKSFCLHDSHSACIYSQCLSQWYKELVFKVYFDSYLQIISLGTSIFYLKW